MFERQSKEQILDKMTRWSRAVTPKLTDFRRGSVIRTIYEAVAVAIEGLYDRVYRSAKRLIESNLYAVMGYDKEQSVASSGTVTFYSLTPATEDILIPAGTAIVAEPTQYRPPLVFQTIDDIHLLIGYSSVSGVVVCDETGAITNIEANTLVTFVSKPFGIDSVKNTEAFVNGKDEETPEAQKMRFQDFMEANTRGTLQSIEYGAKKAYLLDVSGNITEKVVQAIAVEDLVNKLGQVDVYIWNGVGSPSEALKTEIQKILRGWTNPDGSRVYGYKLGGSIMNIYPAIVSYAKIKLTLTVSDWATEADVKATVEKEIKAFFNRLRMGQTVVHSELATIVKLVDGVYDVKVELSTNDGASYFVDNITVASTTIVVNNSIIYG